MSAAEADLVDIAVYVGADSRAAAKRLVRGIQTACERLRAFPHSGAERPDLAAGVRILIKRPYRIIYQTAGGSTRILRILHSARETDEILP